MQIYFSTRAKARNFSKNWKQVDNGSQAPKGRRWGAVPKVKS